MGESMLSLLSTTNGTGMEGQASVSGLCEYGGVAAQCGFTWTQDQIRSCRNGHSAAAGAELLNSMMDSHLIDPLVSSSPGADGRNGGQTSLPTMNCRRCQSSSGGGISNVPPAAGASSFATRAFEHTLGPCQSKK